MRAFYPTCITAGLGASLYAANPILPASFLALLIVSKAVALTLGYWAYDAATSASHREPDHTESTSTNSRELDELYDAIPSPTELQSSTDTQKPYTEYASN